MSQASDATSHDPEVFLGTEQITSAPTPDGRPAAVEKIDLPSESTAAGEFAGEQLIWQGRYSLWNFAGSILWRVIATVAFIPLANATWNKHRDDLAFLTILLAMALVVTWSALIYRMLMASLGHLYTLTNRRLVSSQGILSSRKDQMELSAVNDVFTRHSILERWLSLGTVVVVSSEREAPVVHLAGVREPDQVMELIGKLSRAEHDRRNATA